MASNTIILTQPENEAVLNHEIPNETSARLNYDVQDIEGLAIGPNGELVISFEDGGQVNITNFETFTEDGNLLYLSDGTLVDATILTSAPLNPMALNNIETAAGTTESSIQTISKPAANTSQEVSVQQGVNYVCDFDPQNAALVEVKDGQMVLTFADGSQVVINNYNDAIAGQLPEELTVADAAVVEENLLTEVTEVIEPSEETLTVAKAEPKAEPTAEQVANIEPAAGESLDAVAQQLNQIETAAGDTGGVSGGGYGFNSSPADVTFGADPAVGPLGPTQLAYNAPQFNTDQFIEEVASAPVDPEPTMSPEVLNLDETNLGDGPLVAMGDLNVDFGGDGNGGIEPNDRFEATCEVAGVELTSGGVPVEVEVTDTGYVGTANGEVVFTFEIDGSGEYTYTQVAPLDHADVNDTNEAICLEFGIRVIDGDGDRSSTTVKVNVLDDAPELLSQVDTTVDETNTDANGKVSVDGQFFAEVGQDVGATYGGTGVVNTAAPLTSNGEAVTVTYDAATATYTGATATDTIFTVEMDTATGEYVFTLCGPLDHPDASNPDEAIAIEFGAFITDFDGDTKEGTFTVNVKDDAPTIADSSAHVDETDGDKTTQGSLDIDFGYDGAGEVCGVDEIGASLQGLTSNGEAVDVTFDAATNTYTGSTATGDVFTLVIDAATGDYTFALTAPLDHPDTTDNDDEIVLDFGVKIEDNDGDQSTATISITVDDDGPEINSAQNVVDETDGNVTVTGNVPFDGGFDGVKEFCATGDFDSSGSQLAGALTSNGVAVEVSYDAATGTYTGAAGNETIFTMTVDADGSYAFELLGTLDHADANNANDIINLDFAVKIEDNDGDTKESIIRILVKDDVPTIGDSSGNVDETNFDNGPLVYNDVLNTDFGADLAEISLDGNSDSSVPLISNGQPVTINNSGNTYTGTTPNGDVIFTMVVNTATGEYEYTQFAPLEHPDSTNPDDVISIDFGVQITSNDGDADTGTITITIADDGPVANDDISGAEEGQTITGDVTVNDDFSEDGGNTITNVNFEGTDYPIPADGSTDVTGNYGTLTINSDGTYEYVTNNNDPDGVDSFVYTLTDLDGDTSTAKLDITVTPDGQPIAVDEKLAVDETNLTPGPMVFEGDLDVDFGIDGAGTVTPKDGYTAGGSLKDGTLTSNDVPVEITLDGNTYTGKAGDEVIFTLEVRDDGTYTFTLLSHLDHADATDPNDAITLDFPVMAMDADGDEAMGNINILIYDDAPVAYDDGTTTVDESATVSGNVTDNDELGEDKPNDVVDITFNGVTTAIPATGNVQITGDYGTLTISSDGTYSYTANDDNPDGTDTFTYTLQDFDGDQDTAEISFNTNPLNDTPTVVKPVVEGVDETNLDDGPLTVDGTIEADFKGDGPGTINPDGNFGSSVGDIVSCGKPVEVTSNGDGYVGTREDGVVVFRVDIDDNGDYVFTQFEAIDHPDGTDANDVIRLDFGVVATDSDGDTASTTLSINVYDDGPTAAKDTTNLDEADLVNGSITATDGQLRVDFGEDGQGTVKPNGSTMTTYVTNGPAETLMSGGSEVIITQTANGYVGTANGETTFELTIANDGSYTYTQHQPIDHPKEGLTDGDDVVWIKFGVTVTDKDGDTADTVIQIDIYDDGPVAKGDTDNVGEGDTTSGNVVNNDNYGSDGAGSVISVKFGGQTFEVAQNGVTTINGQYGVLKIQSNGQYTYTASEGDSQQTVQDVFTYTIEDFDGDTSQANLKINVAMDDDVPVIVQPQTETVDETNLDDGPLMDTGTIEADFKGDGPGTIDPNGTFTSSVGDLTSCDKPVTVTNDGTTYTGTRSDGVVVFTLAVQDNGDYKYTQFEALDHPNTNNPNDALTLNFGVTATDSDGDTDSTTLSVKVLDDGPVISSKARPIDESDVNADGEISYTHKLNFDFGEDGAGAITTTDTFQAKYQVGGQDQQLKSGGEDVTVTSTANGYTGTTSSGASVFTLVIDPTSGQYTYTQLQAIDHPDGTNHDDVIWLKFGVEITDKDGDTAQAMIVVDLHDDGPRANDDTGTGDSDTNITGNVTDNDDYGYDGAGNVIQVTFGNTSVDVPETGSVSIQGSYGTLTISSNGDYTYSPIVHGAHATVADEFTYTIQDFDNDTDTAGLTIDLTLVPCPVDDSPEISKKTQAINEEELVDGVVTKTGKFVFDYGDDGAGSIDANGEVIVREISGGDNVDLYSCDKLVTITSTADGYVGTRADGVKVFDVVINDAGEYTYNQYEPVDHPKIDQVGADDVLWIKLGVTITDKDGDTAQDFLQIDIRDDGPSISTKGHGLYESSKDAGGVLVRTGTMPHDFGADGAGSITSNGNFSAKFQVGGQDQTLTSAGDEVFVTQTATGYVGKLAGGTTVFTIDIDAQTGEFEYKQYEPVDHPDTNSSNEAIWLKFGVTITDKDGDTDDAIMMIDLHDDGPDAKNDTTSVTEGDTATGNVITNDDVGYDDDGCILNVKFGNNTVEVPATGYATIAGTNGTLKIKADGSYIYTPKSSEAGGQVTDKFTYTLKDGDGDTDTAILTVNVTLVADPDDVPTIIKPATEVVDETNLDNGSLMDTGTIEADFKGDGPGTIDPNGTFTSSVGDITSCDKPVTVTNNGTSYTGTRSDGVVVFTLAIQDNGDYKYTQFEALDHPNAANPNDALTLNFGVTATDADGDTASTTLSVKVLDDGPEIHTQTTGVNEILLRNGTITVNKTISHDFGEDGAGTIEPNGTVMTLFKVGGNNQTFTSGGDEIQITKTANGYVGKAGDTTVFTLSIADNGSYTYKQLEAIDHPATDAVGTADVIWLKLGVTITDKDGDTADAFVQIDIRDDGPDAKNDTTSVTEGDTATGNVIDNDIVGADEDGCILNVKFGNNTVEVPATGYATIAGTNGTLKIKADGSYIYTPKSSETGGQVTDKFTYTLKDGDGDTDTAILTVNVTLVADPVELDAPEGKNDFCTIVLPGQDSFSSNLIANDTFDNANGRIQSITFGGQTYNIAQTGVTVIAVAFGEIAMKSNGDYTFTVTDPDNTPTISQNFDITITDASGKTDTTLFQFNIVGADLDGTEGKDVIKGSSADDIINGNGEEDTLYGRAGNDTIRGGNDNDYVDGGLGNDTLYGDAGNDLMAGREGNDTIYGGSGNDDIYGDGGVNYDYSGNDTIYGEAGDDYISGDKGRDTIYGGSGNDDIYGGDGNDVIYGGTGNDDIIGGKGSDTLTGGDGADKFWFTAINEGLDTIKDFDAGEDTLELSNMLTGFDAGEDINDFLFAVKSGGSTTIHANNNGDGNLNNATAIVKLEGEDLSINDLMANGNIIV